MNLNEEHLQKLKEQIAASLTPVDVKERLFQELWRVETLTKLNNLPPEADKIINYLKFCLSLPWEKENMDILDIQRAAQILNKNHFGIDVVKERILEYLSVLILNRQKNQKVSSNALFFVGLVGSGKTSLAYSIAEVLSRPIVRIPFGGLGSAFQLRGESRIKPEAEPGLILKAISHSQVKNPVILLDELDRVTQEARADIMGVLVEILDPEQNTAFLDHYLDLSFDLSEVLFIATANNTNNISTAVLDRLELIEMPFYSDEQKIIIGSKYLLPEAIKKAGLDSNLVQVDPNLWSKIVRPLGFDGGIRSLNRTIESLVRKIAYKVVQGSPGPFIINEQTIEQYLK